MKINILLLFITCKLTVAQEYNESEVDELVRAIENATSYAQNYEIPKSAKNYEAGNNEAEELGAYDYVVIGGGSGGAVVTHRLAESNNTVLLLEAGDFGDEITDVPNDFAIVEFGKYNWGFNTTSQQHACLGMVNQQCFFPRGRGVGGTTLINGLIYARGYKQDFEEWAKLVNDDAWNYENVLRAFKKSEALYYNEPKSVIRPDYHGTDGLLNVQYNLPRGKQIEYWMKANEELGYKSVDYNANEIGASSVQINTNRKGQRWDTGKAFVKPFLGRKNLKVLTNSYVTKLIIEPYYQTNRSVVGVEFSKNNKKYFVEIIKEVILCAGAIQTPQILMLSGVGPADHLRDLGIDMKLDLKVGLTLRDHPNFIGLNFKMNHTEPTESLRDNVKKYLRGIGALTVPNSEKGIGFYPTTYSSSPLFPNIELIFHPANCDNVTDFRFSQKMLGLTDESWQDLWGKAVIPQTFFLDVIVLHSKSVGTIKLNSSNPYEFPLINSNFLSDPEDYDINTLYEGVQLVLKLINTDAFRAINVTLQSKAVRRCKAHEYLSRNYWNCAIRQLTSNIYHPVGTCPMGINPGDGVVDSRGRVFGTSNLRIADASVFPLTLAGHPSAAAIMVAEIISEFIKHDHLQ